MNRLIQRLRKLVRRRQLDRDLEDELAFHLAMSAEQSGDPAAARLRLGNPTALKESCRELWTFASLETWWQDLRAAVRTLRSNPLVTVTAVVALALGIGANTTVFTVVSSALRFDMGVDHVERLVTLQPGEAAERLDSRAQPLLDFVNLRREVKTVPELAAYSFSAVNVSDSHALPDRLWRVQMTASGWAMVRPKPLLGREFGPQDELPAATPTTVLSYPLWQRRYGGNPAILGQTMRIDDVEHVVIGVMPAGEQFPENADLWTPATVKDMMNPAFRRSLLVFGRLADGVTVAAAQSEVDAVARRAVPGKWNGPLVHVRPLLELIGVYDNRARLWAVAFAVGFVLLIVCADVANLLLARAAARAREISIRIAIGAGRARIVRQLLVESLLLSAAGGFAGWLIALAGLHWFESMVTEAHRPAWVRFSLDARGFAYLAAVTIGAGILFGLAPALQLARIDVIRAIKDGGRGAEGGVRGRRLAGLLVGFQMALCVVLLAGAGLMIHSSVNLYSAPIGFDPANILTMQVSVPETKYPDTDSVRRFFTRLQTELGGLAGVKQVAFTSQLPLSGWREFRGEISGAASSGPREFDALVVDAQYFETLGVRLRRGRNFEDRQEVVVNQAFAEKCWPGKDPIGQSLRATGPNEPQTWLTVVGVAPNIDQNRLSPLERTALVYLPYDAQPQRTVNILARTAVPPGSLSEAFRRTVQSLDENIPAENVLTLETHISRQRLDVGSFAALFSMFSGVALLLAWVGLYAVVAHAVSRRTQEIGLRMAMGGTRRNIFGLVLRQGMRQVAGGFLVGIPLAMLVTRMLSRGLVGVSPADPVTYGGVALVLGLAGFLGCAIPARRAIRVDPLAALRHE